MTYIVTSPAVSVWADQRTQLVGPFYQGDVLPEGLEKEHLKMLLDEDLIEEAEIVDADSKPSTVAEILDTVGSDKALAQQYLDEENAAGKPRVSLVEKLTAVLQAEEA